MGTQGNTLLLRPLRGVNCLASPASERGGARLFSPCHRAPPDSLTDTVLTLALLLVQTCPRSPPPSSRRYATATFGFQRTRGVSAAEWAA